MDAKIRIADVGETGELSKYARRRLAPIVRNPAKDTNTRLVSLARQPAEGRFGPRSGIEGVSLSVGKAPGRGPQAIHCQILVRVSPSLRLSVEKSEVSAHAAIDAAADRLGWALGVYHGVA